MPSITIRRLDDTLKARLRVRAACHGRSMEQEAREIPGLAAEPGQGANLADSIRRHVVPLGGIDLAMPTRQPVRRPPKLGR